jgi:hypothetical protein
VFVKVEAGCFNREYRPGTTAVGIGVAKSFPEHIETNLGNVKRDLNVPQE